MMAMLRTTSRLFARRRTHASGIGGQKGNPVQQEKKGSPASGGALPRVWAVARYELTWDLRKKRTYVIVLLILLFAILIGYVVPVVVGTNNLSVLSNFAWPWWILTVFLVFNEFVSGLFPLLMGGYMAAESIAAEFDKGTIVPLLSQPIRRWEMYLGKFLEKVLVLLGVAVLLVVVSIGASEASLGGQQSLLFSPWIVLAVLASFLEYAALALFFGSFLKSSNLVFVILLGLLFGVTAGVGIVGLKVGPQLWMNLIPVANVDNLLNACIGYLNAPSGSIAMIFNLAGAGSASSTFSTSAMLAYTLAGFVISMVVPLATGYAIFRRAEVKG